MVAALDAADAAAAPHGQPSVVLCDTKVGFGVPLLENREKAHFMRIDEHEWQICREQLDSRRTGRIEPMTTTTPTGAPKLKTSAMIASFADGGPDLVDVVDLLDGRLGEAVQVSEVAGEQGRRAIAHVADAEGEEERRSSRCRLASIPARSAVAPSDSSFFALGAKTGLRSSNRRR